MSSQFVRKVAVGAGAIVAIVLVVKVATVEVLRAAGYQNAHGKTGGMRVWRRAGFEIEGSG